MSTEVNSIIPPKQKRTKKVKPTCNICCENFNKSVHIPIECMYCKFKSCRKCCETYILSESVVKCINADCGKEWTRKFIRESFTSAFILGPLKKWREELLFQRERALLPATQPYIEAINRRKQIDSEILVYLKQISKINRHIAVLRTEYQRLSINPLAILDEPGTRENDGNEKKERRQFIKPCPADDCRGFLSNQWKCGTCNVWTCPDCNCIIGLNKSDEHTCDPNDVESAKLIKMDTKPCPKCAVPIFKTDGCDQMWCTQCHIAFSWKTGLIETNIHNPHYYEWLRRTQGSVPRNPLDLACRENQLDGRITRNIMHLMAIKKIDTKTKLYQECVDKMAKMERNTLHYRNVVIPRLQAFRYEENNRELRIDYMMQKINEDCMKILLQRAEKKTLKEAETREVYQMVCNTAEDIIFRFYRYIENLPTAYEDWNGDILKEMDNMLEYANECIEDICKTYNCKLYPFSMNERTYMQLVVIQ